MRGLRGLGKCPQLLDSEQCQVFIRENTETSEECPEDQEKVSHMSHRAGEALPRVIACSFIIKAGEALEKFNHMFNQETGEGHLQRNIIFLVPGLGLCTFHIFSHASILTTPSLIQIPEQYFPLYIYIKK